MHVLKRWASPTIGIVILSLLCLCCQRPPETLKVGYIPIAECAPLFVAQTEGLFAKHGVEVELVSLSGGATILNALRGGSLDIGFSNVVSLVLHSAEGAPFVSVYGATYETANNQNHAILTRLAVPGDSLAAFLKTARIAVNTRNNIEELMTRKYLETVGVPLSGDRIVEAPFPQMLSLLEAGRVDAVSVVEPFIAIAQHEGTANWLCNHYIATSERTLVATYVSSSDIQKSRGAAVGAFIKAMTEATALIASDEGKARQVIGQYTKIPPELLLDVGLSEFANGFEDRELQSIVDDCRHFGLLSADSAPSVGLLH